MPAGLLTKNTKYCSVSRALSCVEGPFCTGSKLALPLSNAVNLFGLPMMTVPGAKGAEQLALVYLLPLPLHVH